MSNAMASDDNTDWAAQSPGLHDTINMIERICSIPSVIGCVFIITTFCLSERFQKPINRLAFFAIMSNKQTRRVKVRLCIPDLEAQINLHHTIPRCHIEMPA